MKRICLVLCAVLASLLSGATHAQTFDPANGPWGNRIYGIMSNAAGDLFVGTRDWFWKYSGGTWTKIQLNPNPLIKSIPYGGISPWKPMVRNGSTMLYVDDQLNTDNYIWRSTNNGSTWTSIVQSGLPDAGVNCFAVDTSGAVLAGSNRAPSESVGGGVWRSTDNGSTWSFVGVADTMVRSISVRSDGYMFVATNQGMYASSNHGGSWTLSNTGLSNTSVVSLALNSSGHVFAGTFDGVFKSTDNGSTWTRVDAGFTSTLTWCLAITSGGDVYAGTVGGGVYKSTNGGSSWSAANTGFVSGMVNGLDIQALMPTASGDVYAGTYVDGMFKSTNGGASWTQFGVPVDVKALATKDSYIFVSGSPNYLFRSTDNGSTWTRVGPTTVDALAVGTSGNVFAGTPNAGLYKSTDNGATWDSLGNPGMVLSLASHPDGPLFAGTPGTGVYKSTDDGASWTQVYAAAQTVWSLAVNQGPPHYGDVYAGSSGSSFQSPSGVFRSTDDGASFDSVGLGQYTITSLSSDDGSNIFAGTYDGIYRSSNNGNTWSLVSGNAPAKAGRAPNSTNSLSDVLSVNAASSFLVFAGTNGNGLFRSADSGDTWTEANDGLSDIMARTIHFDGAGHVIVGTSGGLFISQETVSDMMPPSAPPLELPTNGASSVPVSVELVWNANPSATSYRVQVATDSAFATIVADVNGVTDTSETVSGLGHLALYYWRVSASNGWGTGSWCGAWSFTTIVAPPAAPVLASPANGEGGVPNETALSWNETATAVLYRVQLALDESFVSPLFDTSGVEDTSIAIAGLDSAVTYRWRVSASNEGGASSWSDVWYFTTSLYSFEYAFDGGWNMMSLPFTVPNGDPSVLFPDASSNAFEYSNGYMTASVLAHGKGYWIKFDGPASEIIAGAPIASDTIDVVAGWNMVGAVATPIATSAIESNPPSIVTSPFWRYSGGQYATVDTLYPGKGYWVKASSGGTLMVPYYSGNAAAKIRIVPDGDLPPPPPSQGDAGNNAPQAFALYQNYPNPFNPVTTIRFDLPDAALVRLTVTNVLGQEVRAEVREYPAGSHRVALDFSELPSGIYLYRVEAGSFATVRKMILLK